MAKARTAEKGATAADRAPKGHPATVSNSDVARHAYHLYLARGCEQGLDVADWLQAERELDGSTVVRT